jgi:two-component system sensor histidine kinase QseC
MLVMVLMFTLGLTVATIISTHETRVEDESTLVAGAQHGQADQEVLVDIFIDETFDWLLVFLPFAIVSSALVWLIGQWSLRPLARASREAAAIGPANPSGRVSAAGLPCELQPLVDAVNGALARLDHAYATQRRFTADAAHELRTPLTVLNLRLQRAKLDATVDWQGVEQDLAQVNRLVDQLLKLARMEHPVQPDETDRTRPVNLTRVVREAAATILSLAEEKGRPLEVEAPNVAFVRGQPGDLRDVVRNLLDNALTHGEGTVRVEVREEADDAGRRVLVEVSDQGPGIADELKEAVFDRFRKAKPTSPGAGLGLAIVRHIVRAHGGEVRVRSGPGCTVEVALPGSG